MEEILEFKERKNTHQTHFEDLVLLGEDGLNELNDKIEKFMATLGGQDVGLNTTTKIDGAPAVICWSKFEGYPDNSICLKSFVTSNKNALSSVEDIQAKYGDRPDMAEKLMYCLELAKCIPANEAWQGDCLYSKGDLKEVEIQGTNYLTFHPNKIIYAFSEDNPTYNTIKNSSFGICFHTIYKAANEGKKTQSFRVDAKRLNNVPENIYVMSPALNKSNNKADYNMEEVNKQFDELKQLEKQLLSNSDYEDLCDNSVFMGYWNTFENANLSDKRAVNIDLNTFFDDLKAYIKEKQTKAYDKKMSTLKTDAGREKATNNYNSEVIELEDILNKNEQVIRLLVQTLNTAANIKMNLWNGFKKSEQGYNTFYKSKSQGYIPADMEGVAMSDADGNIVKIVDRSTFSFANRSDDIESGFEHNESLEEDVDNVLTLINKADNYTTDSGNCGNFALALREVLCEGDLVFCTNGNHSEYATDEDAEYNLLNGEPDIWHVALKVGDNLYDGTGKITVDDLEDICEDNYGDMDPYITVWSDVDEDKFEKIIRANTDWFISKDEFVDILKGVNESVEPAWVKNTVNKVQNSDKDPAVIATKEYHSHKKNKKPMKGAVISSTPGLVGAVGESLTEDVNKTAVLAFGRMNPPTVGHQKMVDTMAQAANKYNADPKLYLSHTQDSKKNPLSYEQKIEYAKKAFGDKVEVVESPAKTIMHVLVELYEQGYNNLIYIGGEDRIGGDEDITATISKYNGNPEENPKALYNFNNIEFINAGGRNANSNDFLETVSASMVRELVRNNDFDTFKKTVPFEEDTAAQLFNDIKAGLGLKEDLIGEAEMKYPDATKHNYYNDVIDNFLGNGVKDKFGNIFKAPDNADKEAIRNKLISIKNTLKDDSGIFKEIVGQDWTKIDKAPYSGKGGEFGQSEGQHAEPLVCYLFNGGKISKIKDNYSDKWVNSSIATNDLLNEHWNNKYFVAVHVDGDDISKVANQFRAVASLYKSKEAAEKVLNLEPGTLKHLYDVRKDNWCKADIVLINKNADISKLFKDVNSVESFNSVLNRARDNNIIIPVSLKGFKPGTKPHMEFINTPGEDIERAKEVYIQLPTRLNKTESNNCSIYLGAVGAPKVQFRAQNELSDNLSIELTGTGARGGKGISKVKNDLGLSNREWNKAPIKSPKSLIAQLKNITPNIIGDTEGAVQKAYNKTCCRGIVHLYNAYKNKYNGNGADFYNYLVDQCQVSAVDYYKIS